MMSVLKSIQHTFGEMGPPDATQALRKINQKDGFVCQSCAWPNPDDHRSFAEFCENGAKAVAHEGTKKRITEEFFSRIPSRELQGKSDYWLGQQGRLTCPMILREGATHYEPIEWEAAFNLFGQDPQRIGLSQRSRFLHLWQDEQRGSIPLPALRPAVWDQQPAGLLEHVPRSERLRAPQRHRHRQGDRHPRRLREGGRHLCDWPESRHKSPPNAKQPPASQATRLQDCQHQRAAGSRVESVHQSAGLRESAQGAASPCWEIDENLRSLAARSCKR